MDNNITISVAIIDESAHLLSHRVVRCRKSQLYRRIVSLLDYFHDMRPYSDISGANIFIIELGYYRFIKYKKPRHFTSSMFLCGVNVDDLPF